MEFNMLVRPTVELFHNESGCRTSTQEDGEGGLSPKHQVQGLREREAGDKDQEGQCNNVSAAPDLKLKIPFYDMEGEKEDEADEGFKTPTSSDHKIPVILQCPPAPRKPKPIPSRRKRKANCPPRILLDLSKQIDSLFPSPLDLGSKIKKVKHGNDTQWG